MSSPKVYRQTNLTKIKMINDPFYTYRRVYSTQRKYFVFVKFVCVSQNVATIHYHSIWHYFYTLDFENTATLKSGSGDTDTIG